MIFPGHLAAGYLTTYAVLGVASGGLSPTEVHLLFVAGTLLGDGPDIDVLFYFFSKKTWTPADERSSLGEHRRYITHAPVLWLIAGAGIVATGPLWHGIFGGSVEWWRLFGLLVWLCPWSHFVMDSLVDDSGGGIMWLWPFSVRQFAMVHIHKKNEGGAPPRSWRGLFRDYFKNPLAYIELGISLLAVGIAILSL